MLYLVEHLSNAQRNSSIHNSHRVNHETMKSKVPKLTKNAENVKRWFPVSTMLLQLWMQNINWNIITLVCNCVLLVISYLQLLLWGKFLNFSEILFANSGVVSARNESGCSSSCWYGTC